LLEDPSTRFAGLARAQLMTEVPGASLAESRVEIGRNDAGGGTHRSSAEHKRRRWRHPA
jgi:hypothetical protein